MMIWNVRFNTDSHGSMIIPAIIEGSPTANSKTEAIEKARRIIPFVTNVLDAQASPVTDEPIDKLVYKLWIAFNVFCNCSQGMDSISDDDFDAGIDHYYETGKVLWKLNRENRR